MKKISKIFLWLPVLAGLLACEDVVQVDLVAGQSQLVVDGFVNNNPTPQTIRLTLSAPYFLNAPAPTVAGAEVTVTNLTTGRAFAFTDRGQGNYEWAPRTQETLGVIGDQFALSVRYQGQEFTASSRLYRTTPIDSITYELEQDQLGQEDGYYAQFWGTDQAGARDFYWIKTYKNDRYQDKPQLLSVAADATGNFNPAFQTSDGFPFIPPIRDVTDSEAPYQLGDSLRVEVWSIDVETFLFFQQAQAQMTNSGLFARPPENVRTNLRNRNAASPTRALGWFCVSSVQVRGLRIRELAPGARGKG
jgi:hypothetical protein